MADAGGQGGPGEWDFFISYTAADSLWAEWVAWQLEDADYRVLIREWDFVPGSDWAFWMDQGIRRARRTIVLLSAAYLGSVYGGNEWRAARAADPEGFSRRLIPVRVEDCERPGLLHTVVSIDLFGMSADATRTVLLERIGHALSNRAKPSVAPPFPVLKPGRRTPPLPEPEFPAEVDTCRASDRDGAQPPDVTGSADVMPIKTTDQPFRNHVGWVQVAADPLDGKGATGGEETTARPGREENGEDVEWDPCDDTVDAPRRLSWDEVEPVAKRLLWVWADGSEFKWAAEAWRVLAPSGLTAYLTERGRVRCLIRALALGAIYRNFCSQAFEEGELDEWKYYFDVDDLVGSHPLTEVYVLEKMARSAKSEKAEAAVLMGGETDFGGTELSDVICLLVEQEYLRVGGVLRNKWGDARLFATMMVSRDTAIEYPILDDDVFGLVNNDVGFEKQRAWAWMTESFPPE